MGSLLPERAAGGFAGDEANDEVVAYHVDHGERRQGQVGESGAHLSGATGVEVALQDRDRTCFLLIAGVNVVPSSAQATA